MNEQDITESALRALRDIVEHESGIQIGEQKIELLKNRIRKRLRALKLSSEKQYLDIIQSDIGSDELVNLLDVVSTNHTFFWREHEHFPMYEKILEQYALSGKKEIKTWCAASSSGEEPYTLSIIHQELEKKHSLTAKILATDISIQILKKADSGIYPLESIAALPAEYKKYFIPHNDTDCVEIERSIKERITFKKLNLSKFPFPLIGNIDVIFCRNVMIYFDTDLKQKIINEFQRLLSPGGFLFISHSENLLGVKHQLVSQRVGVYRKQGGLW